LTTNIFPREITSREKDFLFSVLPELKPGYKNYRQKIENKFVVGYGRFGNSNLILGEKKTVPDLLESSSPVFAIGTIICEECEIDVLIHEENDEEIEFDISARKLEKIPEDLTEITRWNYSEWQPGEKAPYDNSFVREIEIKAQEFLLALAPFHKKIWLYSYIDGVNHIIPVTNFYNYIMMIKKNRDSKTALNPALMFKLMDEFTDLELKSAFVAYNNYFNRVSLRLEPHIEKKKSKRNFWNLFKKEKS
jgi:hypothetical protein